MTQTPISKRPSQRSLFARQQGFISDSVATNLGIVLGLGLLGWAIVSGSAATRFFYNMEGIAIVLGGTVAATLISFPLSDVLTVFDSFRIVFLGRNEFDSDSVITEATVLSVKIREEGTVEEAKKILEEERANLTHPFLKDGLALIVGGYTPQMIRETMETSIANRSIRETSQVKLLRAMGGYAPTFGMLGTLIGMVQMMASMQAKFDQVGNGLAVAMITTFYGVLLANLLFHPMAEKLEARRIRNMVYLNMIMTGTLLLHARHHPIYIEGVLNSFLPPGERTTRFNKKGKFTGNLSLEKSNWVKSLLNQPKPPAKKQAARPRGPAKPVSQRRKKVVDDDE